MFIYIKCQDTTGKEAMEICTFYGMRYDFRYNSVVLSTDHDNHDYIFHATPEVYDRLTKEFKELSKEAQTITFENCLVYRCKKGSIIQGNAQNPHLTAD